MDKFNEELKKASNPWIQRIGNYLLSRDDIRENLKKENKSLKECFDYVLIKISEKSMRVDGIAYAAGDDEKIYELAVHYYDEDDIKVGKKNFTTNADGSADAKKLIGKDSKNSEKKDEENVQKKIDTAVKVALEKYKKEEKEKEQKKKEAKKAKLKTKKSAKNINDDQMNIFELMGDDNV